MAESPTAPQETVSDVEAAGHHRMCEHEGTPSEGSSLSLAQMLDTSLRQSLGEVLVSPSKGAASVSGHPSPSGDNLAETLPPFKHNFFRIDDEGVYHSAILRGDDIMEKAIQQGIRGL